MKTLLSIGCLMGLSVLGKPVLAQNSDTSVQISGSIRTSVNRLHSGSAGSVEELRDNASRLAFKGREDLGGGMKALFGLELGINADDGTITNPAFRHSYVGLQSNWGTVALGRLDSGTPVGSPLYSQVVNIINFAPNDGGATAIGTAILNARNRTSNSIGYKTPTYAGLEGAARYYWRGAGTVAESEDSARSLDLGINYTAGPLRAGISYGKDARQGGLRTNEFDDKWQAGVRYGIGMFEPYVLVGVDHYRSTAVTRSDVKFWLAGLRMNFGRHAVVLNVMERDVQSSLAGQRRRQQIGYQYALSKRTEFQAFIDHDSVDSSKLGIGLTAIGAGIRHDF